MYETESRRFHRDRILTHKRATVLGCLSLTRKDRLLPEFNPLIHTRDRNSTTRDSGQILQTLRRCRCPRMECQVYFSPGFPTQGFPGQTIHSSSTAFAAPRCEQQRRCQRHGPSSSRQNLAATPRWGESEAVAESWLSIFVYRHLTHTVSAER